MTASTATDPESLESRILRAALDVGFARAGIATPERSEQAAERLASWLRAGHHGEMQYMDGALDRAAPASLLNEVRSVLVVALPYGDAPPLKARRSASGPPLQAPLTGHVARYAQGEDYHRVLKSKLERLGLAIDALLGHPVGRRACVDSAPLLERDFAVRAGIGFAAKSTLTIAPGVGSFFLLGELLLELELAPTTAPNAAEGCGTCTRCLTACPTGAFVGPHVLDARRCISYLTIELKGSVPSELRPLIGQHVFGCDICQDVCPWNHSRHAPPRDPELGRRDALLAPKLESLLFLTSSDYRRLVRGTALARVSRARLARNAAIALGNSHDPAAEAPLSRALTTHGSELVRAHAAWALGALGQPLSGGLAALKQAAEQDSSPEVRAEAAKALACVL